MLAKHALSQLSYDPAQGAIRSLIPAGFAKGEAAESLDLVGLGRLELPTSRLSSARSNQLSYKPMTGIRRHRSAISDDGTKAPPITDQPTPGLSADEERETKTAASRRNGSLIKDP